MRLTEIVEYARTLFDAVGAVDNFLILGLESRTDRDLDIFVSDGSCWRAPGFHQHFNLRVNLLFREIEKKGFLAKRKGYSLNIKELAVRSGIGMWGKNSLVISPKFGPWLRFVVVQINGTFPKTSIHNPQAIYPDCKNCKNCLKACPVEGLLEPFKLMDMHKCFAYLQLEKPSQGEARRCVKCLTACKPQSEG